MPMGGGGVADGMGMSPYLVAFIWTVVVLAGIAVVIIAARNVRMMLVSWRDRSSALASGPSSAAERPSMRTASSDTDEAASPRAWRDGVTDPSDVPRKRSIPQ